MTTHTNPIGQTPPIVPGDLFARQQTITGLRALADFLEANPAVPVEEYGHNLILSVRNMDDASAAALVDRTAALLGVEVTDDTHWGGHYTATRAFGRITYRIVHIPEQARAASRARDSYRDSITLDTDQDEQSGKDGGKDGGKDAGRAA
ncbi:hypothetical protein [Actinomadura sp. BRA 177]|uniref:hypothetical protein n=1 Tax=Actinomadura sp. BRA 177 TaxID=2745202 RepID=UPI001594E806|nr:hypothetical protein [Actinomadura sp. BRA 177]NVI88065.1 hypothetical protein [Actinomadura sp. BRA 177]